MEKFDFNEQDNEESTEGASKIDELVIYSILLIILSLLILGIYKFYF